MTQRKHFTVELADKDPDGKPSDLARDLDTDRPKKLRRLNGLTDYFLAEAKSMEWPRGPEGAWIYFPLGDDYAICQWDPGDKGLWLLDFQVGRLKVVRIIPRTDLPGFLARAKRA